MALRNLKQKINDQAESALIERMTCGWTALRAGLNVLAAIIGQRHPAMSAIALTIVVMGDAAAKIMDEKRSSREDHSQGASAPGANASSAESRIGLPSTLVQFGSPV